MATMNISLPDEMKAFVEEQVKAKGFGTVSEYVRSLLRAAQEEERGRREAGRRGKVAGGARHRAR